MTPWKLKVGGETVPESQTATAAIAELKTLVDGQLEATGSLRERVTALESESKHYATKAEVANAKVWAVTCVAGGLLSIVGGLLTALVLAFFRLFGN